MTGSYVRDQRTHGLPRRTGRIRAQKVAANGTARDLDALRAHLLSFRADAHRSADPVEAVHRYTDPRDIEVAGFIASMLAFGRVAAVRASIDRVLNVLGPHPAQAVRRFDARQGQVAFEGFVHRWCRGDDVVRVLLALRRALCTSRSLERFFAAGDDPNAPDTHSAVASFYRRLAHCAGGDPRSRGLEFLLPRRIGPSPFKRGHLFLRWMVRPADGIDLGIWRSVNPSRLLVPLDTHVARIAANLGFTRAHTINAAMAVEITSWLRLMDPTDPTRFDFALCHIGISGTCPSRRQRTICDGCGMRAYCRHWMEMERSFAPRADVPV
jgi:uncharacterized protein (TIGR02757 family)